MLASGFVSKAAWLLLLLAGTSLAAPPPQDAAAAAAAAEAVAETADDADAAACHNLDGPFKPFCLPKANDVIVPGTTYYITWDPNFFPASNTTVKILGFYATASSKLATTPNTPENPPDDKSNPASPGNQHEAFSSENIDAGWGFWQWRPDAQLLKRPKLKAANITLRIVALPPTSGAAHKGAGPHAQWLAGPTVLLKYKDKAPPPARPEQPHKHIGEGGKYDRVKEGSASDPELYLVLPLVFGTFSLVVVVIFFCTRDVRRIDLGDAPRSTRLSRLESSRRRRAARDAEESIHLMDHHAAQHEDEWHSGWGASEPPRKKALVQENRKLK
ncbi:hypothetical protein VTJ83DRAFT_607 [Remersonia thermophila]|uniref:Uncharacterized protein n=1 Tax=Remersonia thermophila TaxID=72144 RepID=A0ABR4DMD1_9PEZI